MAAPTNLPPAVSIDAEVLPMKRLRSQGSRSAGAKHQRFLRDPATKPVPESESDEESESASIVVSLDAPTLPVKRLASQGSRAAGVRVDSV